MLVCINLKKGFFYFLKFDGFLDFFYIYIIVGILKIFSWLFYFFVEGVIFCFINVIFFVLIFNIFI